MDSELSSTPDEGRVTPRPGREELQAELVPVPESPPPAKPIEPPALDDIVDLALRHVRGKRGGDLVAVLLVGSGARRGLTPHSDLDLIALVKSGPEGDEIVRIADRQIDIRYRELKSVEEELPSTPRLPGLLRKARVLFEHDGAGGQLVEKAQERFRQGVPPAGVNERLKLKAESLHWLGKAEDLRDDPATAQYLMNHFLESFLHAFSRIRGFWPTAPAETLRFVKSRDAALGALLDQFLNAPTLESRLAMGRQMADAVFHDVPNPARID
jgi:predicted nucleotidyltransferase